jgi:hypothetical protein
VQIVTGTEESPCVEFENLKGTHAHEETLRSQSMGLIGATSAMKQRLLVVEKALAVIYAYTHDHEAATDDELTLQFLGIRLFNLGASAIKLGLSGYYQQAFALVRDIVETGYLVDHFRTSPEKISEWKTASDAERKKKFGPVHIRKALDDRDGDKERRREKTYAVLSEYASHATFKGFGLTKKQGLGELGPFVAEPNLKAWLEEMVLRLGPAAIVFSQQFPGSDTNFARFRDDFGLELVAALRRDTP